MTVFFDLDRTLMNFEIGEDLGIKTVFETYKNEIKMDYQEFRSTWKEVAQKIFDEYSAGLHTFDEQRRLRVKVIFELNGRLLTDAEIEERFHLYWSNYEKGVCLFPDALDLLEKLKENKIPIGLISNGDTSNQRWKLDKENLTQYFDPIIISGEVGVSKPELRIFEIALNKASAQKESSWYIGDSPVHDIEPALKLGLNVIYLNRKLEGGRIIRHQEKPAYFEVASLDLVWDCLKL
ncbi:HAD family hydrolase [Treponema sp. C6A8]|uniref:HAD family hydrolase n=1 Tax=Treponema sp. C6A8 TaxID=1410609 RepID=UPI000488AD10|nr:HAD family hydrolase [Treponema sp. C6A8]